jgi:hypothetical protein
MASNYTLQDVADMEAALATGANVVRHGTTSVEFKSRDDMLAQLALMKDELGILPVDDRPKIKRLRYRFNKGL